MSGHHKFEKLIRPIREDPVRWASIEHLKGGDSINDFTGHRHTALTRDQTVAYLEATLELAERLIFEDRR